MVDVIREDRPLFGEGEDPSMLECGSVHGAAGEASFSKKSASGGRRSERFAYLEQQQEESKRR